MMLVCRRRTRAPRPVAGPSVGARARQTFSACPIHLCTCSCASWRQVRVERRPAYILDSKTVWDSRSANVFRGPVMFGLPRTFKLDHKDPIDDGPGLLPLGQAHGRRSVAVPLFAPCPCRALPRPPASAAPW